LKRRAVAGSTVNPATIGHKVLLETLAWSGLFDVIDWIPCGSRQDKPDIVGSNHRRKMTELLVASLNLPEHHHWTSSYPAVEVNIHFDDIDGVNTPTIEWLESLQRQHLADKIFWVTGSDSLVPAGDVKNPCELEKWTRGKELAMNWPIVVIPRAGYPLPSPANKHSRKFYDRFRHLIFLTHMLSDISSTEVREMVADGRDFDHLVIPEVAQYIRKNRLYKTPRRS
jgi:nicotinate (nicotinamide) nucleotide adenylyltransferase